MCVYDVYTYIDILATRIHLYSNMMCILIWTYLPYAYIYIHI